MQYLRLSFSISSLLIVFLIILTAQNLNAQSENQSQLKSKFSKSIVKNQQVDFSFQLVPDSDPDKFVLIINNPSSDKLFFWVGTSDGNMLSENTSQKLLRTRMNMSGAEDGQYIVSVSNLKTTLTQKVELNTVMRVSRAITLQ